ncbi:uncharacterized protein EV422DRAFT_244602 [Fimicolochytrium jonesii]|uniref:uncharacterized protein n=1 Tax=Fimicolochytrium jonesii TaxID=1396493 RepID=UPI0022FE0609|nr:uncharacterized protein EV422DRAFT_244602 [Fimicolochytrium jonesii]KAI8825087.1 hypothetical protein EV422DRAFT_244602 [Fimicolochytrium jonesii]
MKFTIPTVPVAQSTTSPPHDDSRFVDQPGTHVTSARSPPGEPFPQDAAPLSWKKYQGVSAGGGHKQGGGPEGGETKARTRKFVPGGLAERLTNLAAVDRSDSIMWMHTTSEARKRQYGAQPSIVVSVMTATHDLFMNVTWADCRPWIPRTPLGILADGPTPSEFPLDDVNQESDITNVVFRHCTKLHNMASADERNWTTIESGHVVELYDPVVVERGIGADSAANKRGTGASTETVLLCTKFIIVETREG